VRVLIAEDDDVSRLLLERLLQKMGHEFISTKNGLEGLEAYQNNEIDMAILDWMMPEMDGIELCKKIRGIEGGTDEPMFIFMVTAKSDVKDMLHALVMGVDDFLTKPVDRKLFEQRIKMGMKYQNFLKQGNKSRIEPVLIMLEEHNVLRKLIHILDAIYDRLEAGIPLEILKWSTSALFKFTLEIHQRKEDLYLQSFINAVTSEHVDWFSDISESSFVSLAEEHEQLESLLMEIQGHISRYAIQDEPSTESLKEVVKSYSDLLLNHIQKEEKLFFPFAEKYLVPKEKFELVTQFHEIDSELGVNSKNQMVSDISEFLDCITQNENNLPLWRPIK